MMAISSVDRASSDSTPITNEINDLRHRARRGVLEAVLTLPSEESDAYLEALAKAPIICNLESDPMIFLRRCDYNVEAAAKRICSYWKSRKELFGERAHLPMTQTGTGALTREDTLSLKAGWPAILPRSSSGLQVVIVDRRQSHPRCNKENRLRCQFYVSHILSQEERAQVEGVIVCSMITTRTGRDPDFAEFQKRLCDIVGKSFPFKCLFHFFVDSAPGPKKYDIQDALGVVVGNLIEQGATDDTVDVVLKREQLEMYDRLKQLGLKPEGLPACLGGTWTYTHFTSWCRIQSATEKEMQCAFIELELRQNRLGTTYKPKQAAGSKDEACLPAERAARQRERNLIHSRRKRERRKQEFDLVKKDIDRLGQEKAALDREAAVLEELLSAAKQIVKTLSS